MIFNPFSNKLTSIIFLAGCITFVWGIGMSPLTANASQKKVYRVNPVRNFAMPLSPIGKGVAFSNGVKYIRDVPFFPQKDYYCGPASLAGILNFYGLKIGQNEIAVKVFNPKLRGSLTIDLLNYAKNLGFYARFYRGTLEDLKENVLAGRPMILFLNLGNTFFPVRHYLVVVGFNDEDGYVITNSGREKDKLYSYNDLMKAWEKTGFGTLQVLPRDEHVNNSPS